MSPLNPARSPSPLLPHGPSPRAPRRPTPGLASLAVALVLLLHVDRPPAASACTAPTDTQPPLPSAQEIAEGLLDQGRLEKSHKQAFNARYAYSTRRQREVRTLTGLLKEQSSTVKTHDPTQGPTDPLIEEEDLDPDTAPRNRSYQERDFQITRDLLDRFDFLPLSRESSQGLRLCKIAFRPRSGPLPEKRFVDRFINRTAGVLWIDERDYTLVRAHIWLVDEIGIAAGILGKVNSLEGWIDREQTPEGAWYTRSVCWQVDLRQLFTRRLIWFRETLDDIRLTP